MRFLAGLALAVLLSTPLCAQSAAPLPGIERTAGDWRLMFQGVAYAQYDRQGGARGSSQAGSINWGMLMATRALGMGQLQLRAMLSLDPVGVGGSGYPLLLQSGEEYHGLALHDRQHPHDAIMQLGASYRVALARGVGVSFYAAPVGEPALGPVAFMMRPSAMDNPVAPISHHWQDATHVSFGVLTAGLYTARWTLEGSWFNGREPDAQRWNIDPIRLDSYAGRLSYQPTARWSLSASYGYLNSPEELLPSVSEHRATFAIAHGAPAGQNGRWNSTLVWGANGRDHEPLSHSVLAESELSPDGHDSYFLRAEYVQKSATELVVDVAPFNFAPETRFGVSELSLGYVHELGRWSGATLGAGVLGTLNLVPPALAAAYGSTTPVGAVLFLRVRPAKAGMATMDMGRMSAMPAARPASPAAQSP